MRIERLEIDGFGRFSDVGWRLDPGLTVFLGANEAGKTTLLNALRALLFGFEATRDGRTWYPAIAGGRRGGRLQLVTAAGESWTVERHGERGGGGALVVRAPSGNQGGQETLDRLLRGADKDLYTNIFAFGLGELQTLASLSAEGVRGRIYGAGAGLGGTSAIDLERRLRQQLDATFVPRGSQRPLNQLLARIEELRRAVADLSRQPEEHAAAHRERESLVGAADALRAEARTARESLARVRQLRAAAPIAAELAACEAELAEGEPSLDGLPLDAVAVLDRLLGEVNEARATLAAIDEELEGARRDREALRFDEPVTAAADEIAALVAARPDRAARAARRRDITAAIARLDGVVGEQRSRAGGWDEARLLALDDSIPSVEATRRFEAAVAAAQAVRAEAEGRVRALTEVLDAGGDPEEEASDDVDAALASARELMGMRAARRSTPSTRLTPAGAAAALGFFAAVALAGWVLGAAIPALAIAAAGAAVVLVVTGRAASRPDAAREAELLARLGLEVDAGDAEIGARWEELAARRARRQVRGEDRERAERQRAELERRLAELADAARRAEEAEAAWAAWLAERGLPVDISPDAARQVMVAAGTARRAAEERAALRRELEGLEAADRAEAARVDALLASLGLEAATEDASREARLAGLGERLDHARVSQRRAAELDERTGRLEARRAPAASALEERLAAVDAHVVALGCRDADELRRRGAQAEARRAVHAAIREHRARLGGIAGGPSHVDELLAAVREIDPITLDAEEATLLERLEALEAEERAATARIGALEARIRELEATEELGARRQELAVVEGRARELARTWAVQAIALRLLQETRARYERERQPDVVRAAESHFERITGGRYARIVAPPGDASVRVETEGGEGRTVDELSRGTAEQLYLALRFGLIEEFARSAEPLPVVMDDILVNFDAERSARAAAAIRQLAERHQVLYFTCHRWTADLLDPEGARTITLG